MLRFLIRRVLLMVLVLVGVSLITYGLTYLMPGDPARRLAGPGASAQTVQSIRHQLGLDLPFWAQYGGYMGRLLHGDLGHSYVQGIDVASAILSHFPITLGLALGGVFFELVIGLPVGVISAYRRGSVWDRVAMLFSLGGISAPPFWLGLILLYYLAYLFSLFPLGGTGSPIVWYLFLPSLTLGLGGAAFYARTFRSTVLDVLEQPYIRMARAKGMPERVILFRHVVPNAILPIVTMLGIDLGYFLGGVFIVEDVFGLPGIGKQAIDAIGQLDVPIILGTVLFAALLIVVSNIVIDLSYALIDPRIRYR